MNTFFLVNLENTFSQSACVSTGALQGSIRGPVFFLIYIMLYYKLTNVISYFMLMIQACLVNI